jgi:non-ribosomal peptide synthetase component F
LDTTHLDLETKIGYLKKEVTKFDVHLMSRERSDGGLHGDLIYSRSLFEHSSMECFAEHFVQMVSSVSSGTMSEVPIHALTMLTSNKELTNV